MKSSIAHRINEALKLRGMKQSDLVNRTKIGKSSISTYLSGSYEPKQNNIRKIALALSVNEDWLLGYDVPMDTTYNDDIPQADPDKVYFLNIMSQNYDLLNKLGRDEAIRRIEELCQLPQYNDEKRKNNL